MTTSQAPPGGAPAPVPPLGGFGPEALRAEAIAKRFGSVVALRDVTLRVNRGEVLGLIGDNGAGKSTLIKIFTGFLRPDAGQIHVNGEPVTLASVQQSRRLGIETVFQDLALVDSLPVFLNLHLNRELRRGPFLDKREMRSRARAYLDDIGINIPTVNAEVANLSGGQRQAIAVARSVYSEAKILLLDEPLAAMGAKEGAIIPTAPAERTPPDHASPSGTGPRDHASPSGTGPRDHASPSGTNHSPPYRPPAADRGPAAVSGDSRTTEVRGCRCSDR